MEVLLINLGVWVRNNGIVFNESGVIVEVEIVFIHKDVARLCVLCKAVFFYVDI